MILTAVAVGLFVGLVVGALGAGGGILSVPALVYLLGLSPHDAAAGSLVIVGVTAVVSLIAPARAGLVRWKDGALFGLLSVVGSAIGARLSALINADLLMYLFGGLLIVVGGLMIRKGLRAKRGLPVAERGKVGPLGIVAAASLTGFLTGLFGVGGGFAVVPMLVLVLSFRMREASATSLLVMIFATAAGLLGRLGTDAVIQWDVVLPFMIASTLAGMIGGPLSKRAPSWLLTVIFGVLLEAVAIATLVATELNL